MSPDPVRGEGTPRRRVGPDFRPVLSEGHFRRDKETRFVTGVRFTNRLRVAGLVAIRGLHALWRWLQKPFRTAAGLWRRPPERLLIAPQDIRTADPTLAADIYAGYFAFGGKIVNAHGSSPFELEPPSVAWTRALAGFSWLRHLRAADTALARANARVLVDDFLTLADHPRRGPAFEPLVVSRRLIAWLSQSPIILDGADRRFYRRFMKGIGRARDTLEDALVGGLDGEPRLVAVIALVELGLCAEGTGKLSAHATRLLAEELDRQILPDGGHIGRNPATSIDLLLDLLPLRHVYTARGFEVPAPLLNAVDRMIPMLRLFRHGDGTLALFNGMGVTPPEQLATVLAYDDLRALPLVNAPHSGYQRIEARDTIVVIDAGRPPPRAFSSHAHAGCASFELSIGLQRLVVNCGAPDANRVGAREAARVTAAHSTLVIDDTSTCRFASRSGLGKWLGDEIVVGPQDVQAERHEGIAGTEVIVAHDGYVAAFGLVHERRLVLRKDGLRFEGFDRLVAAAGSTVARAAEPRPFAVRFHLHPSVRLKRVRDGRAILCVLPNGKRWLFETEAGAAEIEESIYFASLDGPRPSTQIAVHGLTGTDVEIAWSLRHVERNRPQSPAPS
jgi:uncharacterized heparinase superfamily protein